jgi:NTE family protein
VVIAVNIGTPLAGRETLGSVLGVSAQMINILTEQNVQRSLAALTSGDILLTPPLGGLDSSDFDKGLELITLGYGYTRAMTAALTRLSIDQEPFHNWQLARHGLRKSSADDPGLVGPLASVRITGVPANRLPRLQRVLGAQPAQIFSASSVAADLQMLAATGDYARIDYRLEPEPGAPEREGLVYDLNENSWGPNYLRVGLDLRTDFRGQGAFNVRVSHNRHWLTDHGTEWRNRIQLGEAMGVYTAIYQPLGDTRDIFATAWIDARLRKVDVYDANGLASAVLRRSDRYIGGELGWPLGSSGRFGEARVGLISGLRSSTPELVSSSSSGWITRNTWSEHALRAVYSADRLDHANFPQSGHSVHLETDTGRRTTTNGSGGFNRLEFRGTVVGTWASDTLNAYGRFARVSQTSSAVEDYSLGGFQQLSGYRTGQVSGNLLALGRLVWYRRMPWDIPITRGVFVGGSLEAGNAWANRNSANFKELRLGTSLFLGADTSVGPVYVSLVHAPKGYSGIYIFVGRP